MNPEPTGHAPGPLPSVRPITLAQLTTAFCVGAFLGAIVKVALEQAVGAAPAPVGSVFLLLGIAGLVAAMARAAHQRVQGRRERIRATLAVRWLAFARTALVGGTGLVAWFGLWALSSWSMWGTPLGRSRTIWSLLGALGALALAAAGRWLESGLRIPPRDDEDEADLPAP